MVGDSGPPSRGAVATDGSFRLGTYQADDGAVPGLHKVAVFPAIPKEANDDPAVIAKHLSKVARRYQNIQTTPLEFTVKADGSTNHIEIVLEEAGAKRG
jgi:hypothetical protein